MRKPRAVTTVAFPTILIAEVDKLAEAHGMGRSAFLNFIVRLHVATGTIADIRQRLEALERKGEAV